MTYKPLKPFVYPPDTSGNPPKAAVAGSLAPNRRTRPFSDIQARLPSDRCWPKGERWLSAIGMPERTFTSALPDGSTRPLWIEPNYE